ncbi:MAG: hypothetical protein ACJAVA_000317 [Flavobacteriaceae bacterium]|jgi:hypothetical protein
MKDLNISISSSKKGNEWYGDSVKGIYELSDLTTI